MKWFFVSSFSINVLNVAILLIFMIFFLMRIEKKSTATLLLNIFLLGVVFVFVSFFCIFSTLNPQHATAAWWILHVMVFASIAMVQFAYHFPENIHPKESKVALIICTLASCLVYPYYINKTLSMEPVFIFEANSYIFLETPEIGVVIGAEILWMLVVFYRKAAQFSDYRIIGSLQHRSERPGGFSLVREIVQLPGRVIVAGIKISNSKDRRARSIRHLILIFISPVVLIAAIIMAYEGLLSWQVVAHILGTGFMIIVFIFIVVYINSSSEPSTFMVKLVGISLGALLTVIGFGSSIAMVVKDDAYEKQHLIEVGQCKRAVLQADLSTLPEDVQYILVHPDMNGPGSRDYEKIYAKDPDFVVPRMTKEGARLPGFSFSQIVSAQTVELKRQYRKIAPLDATSYFVCYEFYADGRSYEVGFDYMEYRRNLHETGLDLIGIIVGATLFVMLVFPYFFRESLVKPMDALLNGMQKVNQGDLEVVVPVKVEDEIGYLSNSFNRMVQSILEAREELKDSLDHQVKLTESYSCFVPKEFLQFLHKESVIDIQLGDNVQKEMTILFSDIRSFSRLSETMTPQENFNFLNSCLGRIGPVVRKHNGFIDKYIGDAVMALFPRKAEDAVKAAIGMQRVIENYNVHRDKSGYEPIQIGIGVNKGVMMLGTVGEKRRMEGTVISDAVNLASRLEGLTKMYGAPVIISKTTLESIEAPAAFHYRFLDKVRVKGKKKWVEIYEIFDSDTPDLVAMKLKTKQDFENGITLYQEKKFDAALECFKTVLQINPRDHAAGLYVKWCERIQQYGLADEWEGITAMEHK
jgi:class 3 adenylate cyclase